MRSGPNDPMSQATLIDLALPRRHAVKELMARLGCTWSQARRIVRNKRIPRSLEEVADAYLEEAIQRKVALLEQAEHELRLARYRRSVARAQSGMASKDAVADATVARSEARTTDA